MQTLTRQPVETGLRNRVLTDQQIKRLVTGTNQRRHHLVNRALKSGELVRLRRGLYVLANEFREHPVHPLAIQRGSFLELVVRVEANGQSFLVAEPLRALTDLVCIRKVDWQGLGWMEQGLRVDEDTMTRITGAELRALRAVYKH
jgi:hypothetical protein